MMVGIDPDLHDEPKLLGTGEVTTFNLVLCWWLDRVICDRLRCAFVAVDLCWLTYF